MRLSPAVATCGHLNRAAGGRLYGNLETRARQIRFVSSRLYNQIITFQKMANLGKLIDIIF